MSKKQSNPKPKNIKRPAPPPAPPKGRILRDGKILFCIWEGEPEGQEPERPYSDPAVEDMIEGLNDMTESIKKKNEGRMINPRDYLRTVTEGDKKPDRSFIWTEDSMVEAAGKPTKTPLRKLKEGQITKEEMRFRMQMGMNGCVGETKKVYCEDCKYLDHNPWIKINLCYKVMGYNDNPIHRTAIYVDLEACNKNNDCPHYEEKWYKKLWRMFK